MRSSTKGPYNWNQMALQCMRAFALLFERECYRHGLPKKPDNIRAPPAWSKLPSWWAAAHVLPTDGEVQTSAFTHDNDLHPQRGCCTGLQIHNRAIKKNLKIKSCVFKAENLVGKPLLNQSYLDNKLINVVTCQWGCYALQMQYTSKTEAGMVWWIIAQSPLSFAISCDWKSSLHAVFAAQNLRLWRAVVG